MAIARSTNMPYHPFFRPDPKPTDFERALLISYPESRYEIEHLVGTGRYTISRRGSGEVAAVYTGVKD